jgi:uncharacterized lipoprotein YddW (UPF0748 family)
MWSFDKISKNITKHIKNINNVLKKIEKNIKMTLSVTKKSKDEW